MKREGRNLKDILPEYAPPEEVWERLAGKLDQPGLQRLPEYTPDQSVWDSIERELTGRLWWTKARAWRRMAAAMLVVAAGLVWIDRTENMAVSFSEEVYDERLQVSEISEVDYQYDKLMELCSRQGDACSRPDFDRLKAEFEELRRATEDIRQAAGSYNNERLLVDEHIDLENRKATVLNELVKFI